jgi:hypothetical protein
MTQPCLSHAPRRQLAESEEFSVHVAQTLKRQQTFPKHPICPCCDVPMWLSKVRTKPEKAEYFFECQACKDKMSITDVAC